MLQTSSSSKRLNPASTEETDVIEGRLTSVGPWRFILVRSKSILGDELKARADRNCMMTMEERAILAWERIADELALLNQSFEQFLDRDASAASAPPEGTPAIHGLDDNDLGTAPASAQHWAADRESHQPLVEGFTVAGHNYPNLQQGFVHSGSGSNVAKDGKGDA